MKTPRLPRKRKYRNVKCRCKICERIRLVSFSEEMTKDEKDEYAAAFICYECEQNVEQ